MVLSSETTEQPHTLSTVFLEVNYEKESQKEKVFRVQEKEKEP